MNLGATVIALVLAGGVAAFGLWRLERESRNYIPGRIWRVPWLAVAVVATVAAVVLLAHLVSLVTGQPVPGRMGILPQV